MTDRIALSWSGGKDSALALWELRREGSPPSALLSVVDEASGRVAHHGVDGRLLRAQATAAGVDLVTIAVPAGADNNTYEARLREAFAAPPLDEVSAVAFGDLFLEDLRRYRQARVADAGLHALFPLWGRETGALARELIAARFRAVVVSVDGAQLDHRFLGRSMDERLLAELPPSVDPCGENGEFHTFVYDAPVFASRLAVRAGRVRRDESFAWLALEPVEPHPARVFDRTDG